jgi:hypothetical protein
MIFLITILITSVSPLMTKDIEVTPVESQVLPFHLGPGRIIENQHTFIHFIDTNSLSELLDDTINQFKTINNTFNSTTPSKTNIYKNTLENLLTHTNHIITEAKIKLINIKPNTRNKRGLLDIIGKTSKFLFGTLDSDDGEKFNKAINTLLNNDKILSKQIELQTSLNSHLIDNYNNTISTLNRNQLLMKTNLNNFQDKVNKVFEDVTAFTRARNIIEQILLNCQILIRFLDNLENAIMFAKINTLHNSIISTSDLKKMLETLSKLYDQNRIPTFKNFISYYQIANTKVSFYDNRIIFSSYIPLLNTINFDYYHLYPIPQANHIILPPKPYLIFSPRTYQYEDKECPSVEGTFFCDNKLTYSEKDCITSFMQNLKSNNCQSIPVSISNTIIEPIKKNFILIVPHKPIKIKKVCENPGYKIIEKPSVIRIPQHCKITYEDSTFANEENVISGEPFILPQIKTEDVSTYSTVHLLKLHQIKLDDITKLQKEATLDRSTLTSNHEIVTHSISTISLIVVLASCSFAIWTVMTTKRNLKRTTLISKKDHSTTTYEPEKPEKQPSENNTSVLFSHLSREELY